MVYSGTARSRVSKSINKRFSHANIGDSIELVRCLASSGVFDAGGRRRIGNLGDVNQMTSDFDGRVFTARRTYGHGCVICRCIKKPRE